MITILFSLAFCLIGLLGGWLASEKYQAFILLNAQPEHDFEHLFVNNTHPEIYDAEGNLDRGEYIYIEFPPGFRPEDMKDYYIGEIDEEEGQF